MEQEASDKIEALREELRNGRRASKTSESPKRHSEGSDGPIRSSISPARRDNKAVSRDRAIVADDKRSPKKEPERVGPGGGRHGNDGGGIADGNQQIADSVRSSVGSIERIDELTERIDNDLPGKEEPPAKRPVGRPRKEVIEEAGGVAVKVRDTFLGSKGKTLSAKEAEEMQEPLAAALIDFGGYADRYIRMQAKQPEMPDIWGDLTELEAEILARVMIRRGQKNAAAAEVVRNMVNGSDYISAAVIVVPRVVRTAETLTHERKLRKAATKGARPVDS